MKRLKTSSFLLCLLAFTTAPAFSRQTRLDRAPDSGSRNVFSLNMEELLNVKVTTASKFAEKLSDAPGMMSVVTRDELKRFGGLTLREILERVPGFAGSTASFTDRSMVAIRGDQTKINGGHILFLINGRPTREVLEGGLIGDLLESFPVNILERIEVIKGPGSVLYGSNAFSGVVNLITQKVDTNEFSVTQLDSQSKGVASSGHVLFKRGDLSIIASGQFHQKPNWITPVHTMYAGLQNATIEDRGKGSYLELDYKGLRLMSSFTEWNSAYIEGMVGDARWRRGFGDVGYSFAVNPKWDMDFDLTYTRTTLDALHTIPFIDRDSHEVVLEWTNSIRLSNSDHLTVGTLYNHISGKENFYGTRPSMVISEGSRPGGAFYTQFDHNLRDDVKLIAGIQANKIGNIHLNVVPRAGLIWAPKQGFTVKALYSEAFRAPSINETLLNYVAPPEIGGPSLLGNRNLSPEKVATVDIGLGYQARRFQAGVSYFHNKQTHNIILDIVKGSYVNTGNATFQGAELEGKYYFKHNFFLMGSTSYQANEDGKGNRSITPIANFGAKGGVGYDSTDGFTASLFDVHQGAVHGYSHALNPVPGAYDLVNAQVRVDLSKVFHANAVKGLAFVAHAENLTNKAVWLPDYPDSPGDSIFSNRGRTVYFGIELTLKKD